jgi:DNA-binding NarL/FixJ family response regulator
VVVLADELDADNTFECIEAGAVGYLLRNADDCDGVVTGIKKLKHGGAPLDAKVARQLLQRISVPRAARDEVSRGKVVSLETVRLETLTKRERSILALMARGDTYAEVANVLEIAVRTVETHAKNIYRKLAVHSRSEAVFEAHRAGLLENWR